MEFDFRGYWNNCLREKKKRVSLEFYQGLVVFMREVQMSKSLNYYFF